MEILPRTSGSTFWDVLVGQKGFSAQPYNHSWWTEPEGTGLLIHFRTAVDRCNITDSVDGCACSTSRVVVELIFKLSYTKLIIIVRDIGGTSLSSQCQQSRTRMVPKCVWIIYETNDNYFFQFIFIAGPLYRRLFDYNHNYNYNYRYTIIFFRFYEPIKT